MNTHLVEKLKTLPSQPGVYFFKNKSNRIIYIGKAAVLKNRVGSYFQKTRLNDPKTELLVREIDELDWIVTESEVEALFLESEFIKRYKPKYNIDWKDEKNFTYVKITTSIDFPVLSYVRRPLDDKSTYFGPFTSADALRRAMKLLRRVFPYVTHDHWPSRGCLHYHLGLCPGPEEGVISPTTYKRQHIRPLIMYLEGQQTKIIDQIEKEMRRAAKSKDFERAAKARDQLRHLRALAKQMVFGDKEAFDLTRDQALVGLANRLELTGLPRRIEAYDISHLQGSDNVASMIVFSDGMPNRDEYRRFKMRLKGNDDFAHMAEVIRRRFAPGSVGLARWPKPDLILIDGGRGQLAAVIAAMHQQGINIPVIGLAKRAEEIIRRRSEGGFSVIRLPYSSHTLQLLQRIRDESHRFAVTYHALLRGKRQTKSVLDEVPGIGPVTKQRLLKTYGSLTRVQAASEQDLIQLIGATKTRLLKEHLG